MVTEFEYDGAGLLVRSVTTSEPEWTEQDRAEILALAQYESAKCPCGCGYMAIETMSPEETGPEFFADRSICRARLALLEAQEAATTEKSRHIAARMWRVDMRKR